MFFWCGDSSKATLIGSVQGFKEISGFSARLFDHIPSGDYKLEDVKMEMLDT